MMNWVTEEEAVRTFCPLIKEDCRGSVCRAWRWRTDNPHDRLGECDYLHPRTIVVQEPPPGMPR